MFDILFWIREKLKLNRFFKFLKPRPTNGGSNVQFDRERLAASDWSPNARCTLPLKYYDVLFVGPGIEFGLHRVVGWQKVGGNRRQINPPPQEEEEEEEKKRIIIWNKKKINKIKAFCRFEITIASSAVCCCCLLRWSHIYKNVAGLELCCWSNDIITLLQFPKTKRVS